MGGYGLYTKQVGEVGWVHTYLGTEAERFIYGRVVCLSLSNHGPEGKEISFDMTLTREEALELGRALVMAFSVRPEEE